MSSRVNQDDLWDGLRTSWLRHLRARLLAPKTQKIYLQAAERFCSHLGAVPAAAVTNKHVEAFLVDYAATRAPATVSQTYRALQQFFNWLVSEDEIATNPTERMKAPTVPETPVPVLSEDDLKAMLAACAGATFTARRDTAILRLLIDTGGRLAEISNLAVDDLDLDERTATVIGKGQRQRTLPFGLTTAESLDRYLRLRRGNAHARQPALWLGASGRGPMLPGGIYQMVRRRGQLAGIPDIHPHMFRHTASHRWLAAGGNEGDLMSINGWRSRSMLTRYAASAASERARDAHARLALSDKL